MYKHDHEGNCTSSREGAMIVGIDIAKSSFDAGLCCLNRFGVG